MVMHHAKTYLENAGATVYVNDFAWAKTDATSHINLSTSDAVSKNVDIYVSLHSNASKDPPKNPGPLAFFNNKSENNSNPIANENLAKYLSDAIYYYTNNPRKGRGKVLDNSWAELQPSRLGRIPCCILEIDFHDREVGSTWIKKNLQHIAYAVSRGIGDYYSDPNRHSTIHE